MSTGTFHMRPKEVPGPKGKGKRVAYYFAEFREAHRHPARKRVSLHTANKVAAEQRYHRLTREYIVGTFDPWADAPRREGVAFDDAVARFMERKRQDGARPRTVEAYGDVLRSFGKTLGPRVPLHAVEARHVEAFTMRPALADATRATYRRHLAVFFAWAVEVGFVTANPVRRPARTARVRKDLPAYLREEELARLLRCIAADAAMKPHMHPDGGRALLDVVQFAAGTGMRRGEILALRWSAVNLDDGFVTVANTDTFTTKSGRERIVHLAGAARAVVERRAAERTGEDDDAPVFTGVKGGALDAGFVSRRFRHYRRLARLPESIHFHSLRHTFASWVVLRGVDVYVLKDLLGHADVTTTQVYAHLRPEAGKAAIEQAFGEERGDKAAALREENARLRARLDALTNGEG